MSRVCWDTGGVIACIPAAPSVLLIGSPGDAGFLLVFLAACIGGGFWLLAAAWRVLYTAQKANALAASGPYAWVRHPQYTAFILIMFGFLLQWPTILTLLMFPVLVYMYLRLAGREEAEVHKTFGESYAHYAAITPAFFPRLRLTRTRTG